VHGFDLDPQQVAAARALGGGRFEVADAEDLFEQPEGRYDLAVCRKLLLHVRRPTEVLRQMARVVRTGGRVAVIEPVRPEGLAGEVLDAVGEAWLGARLGELLTAAGLTAVSTSPLPGAAPPRPATPTDRDQFLGSGGTLATWARHLAADPIADGLRGGIATVP